MGVSTFLQTENGKKRKMLSCVSIDKSLKNAKNTITHNRNGMMTKKTKQNGNKRKMLSIDKSLKVKKKQKTRKKRKILSCMSIDKSLKVKKLKKNVFLTFLKIKRIVDMRTFYDFSVFFYFLKIYQYSHNSTFYVFFPFFVCKKVLIPTGMVYYIMLLQWI